MLPDEIYASSTSQAQSGEAFKYSHPLNHGPVNDSALRARLAYDLMSFMKNEDCQYFRAPGHDPNGSDDEIDIMIVDGFYKEAGILLDVRLAQDPTCEKALFQQAFIKHLKDEYKKLLKREEKVLVLDPSNVNALINKGFALANLDREEEALQFAYKALRIDPKSLLALGNIVHLAGALGMDLLRKQTLKQAYNISAEIREEQLREQEARLLEDMGSEFMNSPISAFDAFNAHSGSSMVH